MTTTEIAVVDMETLLLALSPLRQAVMEHCLYTRINSLQSLRIFAEHHVFAVFDFMSLLKWLQRRLTGISLPWLPSSSPLACRLINEIVLAEESDELEENSYISHFDLYRLAMTQMGANRQPIDTLVSLLEQGETLPKALSLCQAREPAVNFFTATWSLIDRDSPSVAAVAAALTLGREDIIPEMFNRFVFDLNEKHPDTVSIFKSYLDRHIYVDGEKHRPMSFTMLEDVCKSRDDWREANEAAACALRARLMLWNGIEKAIEAGENQMNAATERACG